MPYLKNKGPLDPAKVLSLEAFRVVHPTEEETGSDKGADDESGSDFDSDDDGDWLFAADRKRKATITKSKDKAAKKRKPNGPHSITNRITSAKIDKLCEILEMIHREDPAEKVVVFSQFTAFLDLVQRAFEERNFEFGRVFYRFGVWLTGSMTDR